MAYEDNSVTQEMDTSPRAMNRMQDETGYAMPEDTGPVGTWSYTGQAVPNQTPMWQQGGVGQQVPIWQQGGMGQQITGQAPMWQQGGMGQQVTGQAPIWQQGGMGQQVTGQPIIWEAPAGAPIYSMPQSQRMKNPVSMEKTHFPRDNTEAYHASLRSLLDRNVGYFIVATFLIGTEQAMTWQGILHTVGSDYLVLYQPDFERYISCDFYSLKFVQFLDTKTVPICASDNAWTGRVGL